MSDPSIRSFEQFYQPGSRLRVEPPKPAPEPAAAQPKTDKKEGKEGGFSFWDFLDIINPLQHIPLVNRAYRALTGDEIRMPAKLAGSALFFGPVGLAVSAADGLLKHETGKDAFEHVVSVFQPGDEEPAGSVTLEQVAEGGAPGGGAAGETAGVAGLPQGRTLAQYRALAGALPTTPVPPKPSLPPAAVQATLADRSRLGLLQAAQEGSAKPAEPGQGPPPRESVADLMRQALDKYQAQAKAQLAPAG